MVKYFVLGDMVRVTAKEKLSEEKAHFTGKDCTVTKTDLLYGIPVYHVAENEQVWRHDELELVRAIEEVKSFNVGDIVLIKSSGFSVKEEFVGTTCEVLFVNNPTSTVDRTTYSLSGGMWCIWFAGELEKIEFDMGDAEFLI